MKDVYKLIFLSLIVWPFAYSYSDSIPHLYCDYKNHFVADSFYYYISSLHYATGVNYYSLCITQSHYYFQTSCREDTSNVDFYSVCPNWVNYFTPRVGYIIPTALFYKMTNSINSFIILPFLALIGSIIIFYYLMKELEVKYPAITTMVFMISPTVLFNAVHYVPDLVGFFFILLMIYSALKIIKKEDIKRYTLVLLFSSLVYTTLREVPVAILATIFILSLIYKNKTLKMCTFFSFINSVILMFSLEFILHAQSIFTAFFMGLGLNSGASLGSVIINFVIRHTITPFFIVINIFKNEFGFLLLFLGMGIICWRGTKLQNDLFKSIIFIQIIWVFIHPYEDFRFFFILLVPTSILIVKGFERFIKYISNRLAWIT